LCALWFFAFAYLAVTTVALWFKQDSKPSSRSGKKNDSFGLFSDPGKDHNV